MLVGDLNQSFKELIMANKFNENLIRVCTSIDGVIELTEYLKIDYIDKE